MMTQLYPIYRLTVTKRYDTWSSTAFSFETGDFDQAVKGLNDQQRKYAKRCYATCSHSNPKHVLKGGIIKERVWMADDENMQICICITRDVAILRKEGLWHRLNKPVTEMSENMASEIINRKYNNAKRKYKQ